MTFHNNGFVALWDCYEVFRLSKNNFLDNFSFSANWKRNFRHFSTVNKLFWHPNQSFRLEQWFQKIGSRQQTTENGQVWEVN